MSTNSLKKMRSQRSMEDFELLSMEVVRVLRGKQSQQVLSRRLGYGSNVLYYWEKGKRTPTLNTVMEMALMTKLQGKGELLARRLSQAEGMASLLNEITEGYSLAAFADRMEVSRSSLSRWRSGASMPSFPYFLYLFDLATGRVLDFLNFFIDVDEVESVKEEWSQLSRLRALVNMMPSTVSILCGLDLEDYRRGGEHDDVKLASRLGMKPMEVHIAISQMVEVGMIHLEGGVYRPVNDSLDLFLSVPDLWSRLGVDAELSGLFAGGVSEEAMVLIRGRMESFLLECQNIVEADRDKTRTIVLSIQMGRLDRG